MFIGKGKDNKLKKLLVFHPAIAPYRIDLFNSLAEYFIADFYIFRKNLLSQKFDVEKILEQLKFKPNFLTFGFDFTKAKRLVRVGYLHKISKHKPDIILCSEYGVITILIALYCRIFYPETKVYTLCDDSIDIAVTCTLPRRIARRICLKFVHGIILGNDLVKNWYNINFSTVPTVVIPIIQKESRLLNILKQGALITNTYNQQYNLQCKKVLLFVGRLTAVKNLSFLVTVFAEFVKLHNNIALVIVGDGDQKQELINLSYNLGVNKNIIFPGRFENEALYAWYGLADYFILPSIYEPFGAVVNEALIVGVPVLCSIKAGASSLINNKNGVCFSPHNKEELLKLLNNSIGIKVKKICNISLQKNLMPYSFHDRIIELVSFLNAKN